MQPVPCSLQHGTGFVLALMKFSEHFSDAGIAIGRVCVCVCVCGTQFSDLSSSIYRAGSGQCESYGNRSLAVSRAFRSRRRRHWRSLRGWRALAAPTAQADRPTASLTCIIHARRPDITRPRSDTMEKDGLKNDWRRPNDNNLIYNLKLESEVRVACDIITIISNTLNVNCC